MEAAPLPPIETKRGYTPREVSRLYRVSPEKVRGWIARGELRALNIGQNRCGKPRFVILPSYLSDFERGRQVFVPQPVKRRKRETGLIDYYPE